MTRESLEKIELKSRGKRQDRAVPFPFRSTIADYRFVVFVDEPEMSRGSGFEMGHYTPARNHSSGQDVYSDTFLLSNIGPMVCS